MYGYLFCFVTFCFVLLLCYKENPVFNVNSVNTDQTSCFVASDLNLHCLPMSHLWDTKFKWLSLDFNTRLEIKQKGSMFSTKLGF